MSEAHSNPSLSNGGLAIMRIPEVCRIVGVARGTIYLWMRQGKFPKPMKLNKHRVGWRAAEVEDWLRSLEKAA